MSVENTQRSPADSSVGYAPSSWADSDEERLNYHNPSRLRVPPSPPQIDHDLEGHSQPAQEAWRMPPGNQTEASEAPQLQSKNPFLKARSSISRKAVSPKQGQVDENGWSEGNPNTAAENEPFSQSDGFIPMTASLSLLEPSENGYPNAGQGYCHSEQPRNASGSVPPDQLPWGSQQGSQHTANTPAPEGPSLHGQAANSYTPAVVVQPSDPTEDPFDHQSAYSQGRLGSDNGAYSPAFSNTTSATSHELIDLDVPASPLGGGVGTPQDISSAYSSDGGVQGSGGAVPSSQHVSSQHLLDYLPTPAPVPSTAPERPRIRLSAAEEARQQEQRSETYSIRQINWVNKSGRLLQSPILVQNKNGPCPLLALINALVLRADPASQPPIVRALQAREQISLGLLIEALFEELVTCLGPQDEFPDIEALSQFLTMLHTGMNVNPRLTLEDTESLGTFAQTADLQLYSTFGVPLIHGWLASWTSQPHHAMLRTAQYHEDIQLLPFKKQELEDRVMRGESLSPDEESTMADIHAIQEFVDVENATQLSPFGLTQLTTRLAPGSVSIFFRNDHFSTLYKHPQSQQLFSLVTDAGYANHAEVVWESLVDVTGYNTEFFSGDFRPVSQAPTGTAGQSRSNGSTELAGPRSSSTAANNTLSTASATSTGRLSPQEQADADYAYALSLQFQEEEQREQNQSQPPTRVQSQISPRTSTSDRNRRASAPLGSPNRSPPHIMSSPPHVRTPSTRLPTPTVGLRPSRQPHHDPDPNDPNAPPPPYEQAARTPPYHSPERQSPYHSMNQRGEAPGGMPNGNRTARSSYPDPPPRPVHPDRYNSNHRNSKDCIVM